VATTPIQSSFASGELSPLLAGHAGSEVAGRGLSLCENFQVLPQGPIRLRAGSVFAGEEDAKPRLIPFRVSGESEDYVLALSDGKVRVYSRATGTLVPIAAPIVRSDYVNESGAPGLLEDYVTGPGNPFLQFNFAVVAGHSYRVVALARRTTGYAGTLDFVPGGAGAFVPGVTQAHALSATFEMLETTFVAGATAATWLRVVNNTGVLNGYVEILRFFIFHEEEEPVTELAAPWSAAQLAQIQYDSEPTKDRVVVVHGDVPPTGIAVFPAENVWYVFSLPFTSPPAEWRAGNYPSTVEVGFQGRMWLGATRYEPHTVWMSKSGEPFNFTVGANPGDSTSFIVSTKGALQWMRGQKVLLVGSESVEHAVSGSARVIAPGDVNVEDESAFGSAKLQALHIGDQVLWITRDLRSVRALDFDLQRNSWVSSALTFLAEHITKPGLKELHFARSPFPCLVGLRTDGLLVAVTYDRGEKVLAWWRAPLAGGAAVNSACVADGPDGSEIWAAVTRAGGEYIERLPLHEVGAVYLDSAIVVEVAGNELAGLDHLEGEEVTLVVAGAVAATGLVVAGGAVPYEADDGTEVVVGLPYRAVAKTLPRAVRIGKVRNAKVGVLLNNSAQPLVNGKRAADRTPATPQDQVEPGRTGRSRVASRGWDGDGVVTLEQDQPVRTEILAIVAVSQAKRV
jgi:hypothetical protein